MAGEGPFSGATGPPGASDTFHEGEVLKAHLLLKQVLRSEWQQRLSVISTAVMHAGQLLLWGRKRPKELRQPLHRLGFRV